MSGNDTQHPGRSVDFLSRLHDGDLETGERARFEAHRARCSECRRAAIEFEDALSLFRSTRSTPPRSDLAARILRRVQSTNRPRAPFPLGFRLDLGWAALLLTALFAILVTTPLVLRQRQAAAPPALPTPAPQAAVAAEVSPAETPAARRRGKAQLSDARPAPRPESRDENAVGGTVGDALRAEAAKSLDRPAPAEARRESARAAAAAPQGASAGGEGDVSVRTATATTPLRLTVHEADGYGTAPALRSETRIALPASERGREYVLLVDAQGTVRGVTPDRDVSRTLAQLRFEAGPRPRRILVRLE